MNTNPLISIIVPCYNVEQYLPQCLDSILAQTYTNLEILLVNDGSLDNSGKICDIYAIKDHRIKVIHKKNGGLSDARNVALDIATGEYVTFIDSDDTVMNDYIECLYSLIIENNAQISITTSNWFYEGEKPIIDKKNNILQQIFTKDEALIEMFYQKSFDTTAWGKLYLRTLFNDIRYPKGLLYEDLATTYRLINKCNKIAFLNYKSYSYLLRKNSIEGSPFKVLKYDSCIKIIEQLESDFQNAPKNVKKALKCRIISFAFHILLEMPSSEIKRAHILFQIIKSSRWNIIFNNNARKKARYACILSLVGLRAVQYFAEFGKSRKSQS